LNFSSIKVVWGKELKSYFNSPIAYIIASLFIALSGLSFALSITGRFPEASLRGFLFGPIGPIGAFFLVILIAPALTMRLFSEEQKLGTLELLLTAPIRDLEIVLGKFFAALTLLTSMFALTLYFPLLLIWFGDPDLLPIMTGYLSLFLMGAMAISVGLFSSSLTSNQIVSAVLSSSLLLLLWLSNITSALGDGDLPWAGLVRFLAMSEHVRDMAYGVLDSRDIVYFISLTAFFLFLTVRAVETRRWK
jgi:ABC-2 type transport system permease protein